MKYKELTTKSEADLKKLLEELQIEAHDVKLKLKLNQENKSHKLKGIKKDIARIKTHLRTLLTQ